MRQHKYEVGDGSDIDAMPGQRTYTVICRSWDDADPDADSWVRVVNWYTDRAIAQQEADALNTNPSRLARTLEDELGREGGMVYAERIGQNDTSLGAEYREAASILRSRFTPATRFNHYINAVQDKHADRE